MSRAKQTARILLGWLKKVIGSLALIIAGATVAAFVLLALNVVSSWSFLIGAATALLAGITILIVHIGDEQERANNQLNTASITLASVKDRLDRVASTLPMALMTADQCFSDLENELRCLNDANRVTIRLLGLGLGRGKNYIQAILESPPIETHLDLQVLAITANSSTFTTHAPKRLSDWCRDSEGAVESIVARARAVLAPNVTLELRRYDAWPFIHGVAIVEPIEVLYFTICRWRAGEYESSLFTYRKVKNPPPKTEASDNLSVFSAFFSHLWDSSADSCSCIRGSQSG